MMIPLAFIVLAALAFLALSLWRPLSAVAAAVVAVPAYLIRSQVGSVPVTALEAAIVGTVVGWMIRTLALASRNHDFARQPLIRIRTAVPRTLWLWFGLSVFGWGLATLVSIDVRASLGSFKAWLIEPALLGLVLLAELKTVRDRAVVETGLLAALLWVSLAGLVQAVGVRWTMEDGRLSSVFAPVANYFAMFAAPLIVYALGLAASGRQRVLALISAAIGSLSLLLSQSFGGYLGLGTGVLILTLMFVDKNTQKKVWLAVGVVAVAVLLWQLQLPYLREKVNFSTRSSSAVRVQIWRTALEVGRRHPVLGVGPNAFEKAYRQTVPRLYFPPLEWLVAKPHNLYLNLWVETGLLSLIGTVGGLVVLLRALFRWRIFPVAAAMVAILVHGLVDTPLFKNDLAVLAVALMALGLHSLVVPDYTQTSKNN